MLSRRDFLKSSTLLALAPTVPGFLANTACAAHADKDGRVLVVIQLDGGNDGINTVVPFADPGYAKHRKVLRIANDRLVKITDRVGLHPSLANAGKLLQAGQLAVVQGVSYPNPNRSHFRSMAIWHSARLDPEEHGSLGWLGRALDEDKKTAGATASLLVGGGPPPVAIRGRRSVASAIERLDDFTLAGGADPRKRGEWLQAGPERGAGLQPAIGDRQVTNLPHSSSAADDLTAFVRRSMLDAYATADHLTAVAAAADTSARYPDSGLGQRLQMIARLLKAGFGTRVYYTLQGGYDTHSAQLQTHSQLLFELAGALKAFLDDLAAARLAERVAVLLFSEFGRTVSENASAGTDHGTSAPVLLAGPGIKAGLVGETPSLLDLDPKHGDLRVRTDFRQVYASILEDWLGLPGRAALGGDYGKLTLFR